MTRLPLILCSKAHTAPRAGTRLWTALYARPGLAYALAWAPAHADSLGLGNAQPEFLPGDVAFQADAWIEGAELVAAWTALPGYYLYEQSFGVAIDGEAVDDLRFPEGETRWDDLFGEVQTHSDQVFVRMALPATDAASQSPVRTITLRYQGCAEAGLCYPPTTTVVELDTP